MSSPPRASLAFAGLLLAVALASGAGFWAGRYAAHGPPRAAIADFAAQHTLGRALASDEGPGAQTRAEAALAYLDPDRAQREMDGYAWAVPTVPIPFVSYGPAPGPSANANINAQQLRYPRALRVPPIQGTVRVLLLGGSTALSAGAPSEAATIHGQLEARLADSLEAAAQVEVAAAACQAWASSHERAFTRARLLDLQPNLVVALSGLNDAHWGALGVDVDFFRAYDDQFHWSLLSRVFGGSGVVLVDPVPAWGQRLAPDVVARRMVANALATRAEVASQGGHYLFALQPSLATTSKPLSAREQALFDRGHRGGTSNRYLKLSLQAIASHARDTALDFVDLTPVFDGRTRQDEIFLDRYHFGDRGNGLIAEALAEAVGPRLRAQATPDAEGPDA